MKVPILCFHDVSYTKSKISITPEKFEKVIKYYYKKNYTALRLSEFNKILEKKEYEKLKNTFVITFDDAFSSFFEYAEKILDKYNYTCNFFITTKYIGKTTRSYYPNKNLKEFKLFNKKELKKLIKKKYEIHAHSHSHNLLKKSHKEIKKDIILNKKIINESFSNYETKYMSFCFPYNRYNDKCLKIIQNEFTTSFIGEDKVFSNFNKKNTIPRIEPNNNKPFIYFVLNNSQIVSKFKEKLRNFTK